MPSRGQPAGAQQSASRTCVGPQAAAFAFPIAHEQPASSTVHAMPRVGLSLGLELVHAANVDAAVTATRSAAPKLHVVMSMQIAHIVRKVERGTLIARGRALPGGPPMLVAQAHVRSFHRHAAPLDAGETTLERESALDRMRSAGAAFLHGTTVGWSRRDLANWLVCQYAPCTVAPAPGDEGARAPATERTRDDGMFERVIVDARDQVVRLLRDLTIPALASPIARLAVASGSVARRKNVRGRVVYSPVARIGLSIHERAESLFIAHYLECPDEYAALRLCSACGGLSFSGSLAHAGWCEPSSSA